MLKCHLVELCCFWWNLSRRWENFKLIVGWPIPLGVLVISLDLSWSLLPTFILADAFFLSYSCCTEIASTKTIKMPMRHFLPGWTSWVKIQNPRDVILAWLSCLYLTHCCWKTFQFSAQSASLHFFYKERQIRALGHSMWPVEVARVGWISTCVVCRVNSGFATTEVQLSIKYGGIHLGNLQNHR